MRSVLCEKSFSSFFLFPCAKESGFKLKNATSVAEKKADEIMQITKMERLSSTFHHQNEPQEAVIFDFHITKN